MKIKELLELTQHEGMASIAKNHLTIGEKPARMALKAAGCYAISGKRGWHFEGDPAVLEKSIYDFIQTHGERKNESTKASTFKPSKEEINKPIIERNNGKQILRKRVSFDINMALFKRLKLYCVANDKNIYEVAEAAVQEYLERRQA
ncbi:hypothetical protein [Domibacillus tundrae]|uniref:hypothetical protein n=1 Tax=Domibacillus tundrae TaxID=1587527 RepID=UPI003393278F